MTGTAACCTALPMRQAELAISIALQQPCTAAWSVRSEPAHRQGMLRHLSKPCGCAGAGPPLQAAVHCWISNAHGTARRCKL